ncbi:MAG: Dihydrolipoyllysine-residue acetyltransferase component of pyruvate dehydrogenase complex [Chlamydiia bacterium]|nr:Dihydrolipoyllysine-residue acetyltransferase component of pyruvate dehydrogenase complex [Chlamydiia bacterium]
MEEGEIVEWLKKEGEAVDDGEVIIKVQTDKAVVEGSVLDGGILRKIVVQPGESVPVGKGIAIFSKTKDESIEGYEIEEPDLEPAEEEPPAEAESEERSDAKPSKAAKGGAMEQPAFVPVPPLEKAKQKKEARTPAGRVKASPLARKIAEEKGIDLNMIVKGSGPGGRIVAEDVEKGPASSLFQFSSSNLPDIAPGAYHEEPLSSMRKVIGARLQQSKTFIPHFYVDQEIVANPLIQLRADLKKNQLQFSVNDLMIRAVALALKAHPEINVGFNSVSNSTIHFETVDISVAVSVKEGLITPIVRFADYKNVQEISAEVKELVKKAMSGTLAPEEFQGGSFTLSNLGMFGVSRFAPIINPPQGCILAVGGLIDKVFLEEGVPVGKKVINVTLAADHRIVDGADGARFVATLRQILESPSLLLI